MQKCGKLLFYGYLLNLFDLAATMSLILKFGIDIEGNPVGRLLLSAPFIAVAYKIAVVGLLMLLIYWFRKYRVAVVGAYTVFTVYLLLGIYHVYIIASLGVAGAFSLIP